MGEEEEEDGAAGKYALPSGKKSKKTTRRCVFRKVHATIKEPVGLLANNGVMKVIFKGDLVSVSWLGEPPQEEEEELELEDVEELVHGEVRLSNGCTFANPDLESLMQEEYVERSSPKAFTRFQLHKEQWVV